MGVISAAEIDAGGGDPTARRSLRERLKSAAARGASTYLFPDNLPVLGDVPQWTASTSYSGMGVFVAVGSAVFTTSGFTNSNTGPGTSGTTAPSGNGQTIADGQVVWSRVGTLAPSAYANSTTVYADQMVVNGGLSYPVLTGGVTAASGAGPTHKSGTATDGTVTFGQPVAQDGPVATLRTVATTGLTQQVAWNAAASTILGGTILQNTTNARGGLVTRSGDGGPYVEATAEGGGSIFTRTDAPNVDFTFTGQAPFTAWSDGKLVALVIRSGSAAQRWLNFDYTGLLPSRKLRTLRFMVPFGIKYGGFFATVTDTFQPYISPEPLKVVHIGDSFVAGAIGVPYNMGYAPRLGLRLGLDNYRASGIGSTGQKQTTGSLVAYESRYLQDVVAQSPDIVVIQNSGNDAAGITAGTFTIPDLIASQTAMIADIRAKLPGVLVVVMGLWNNKGPLADPHLALNTAVTNMATTLGLPFIEWSSDLKDGGYVGHTAGSGNSAFLTGDGTHRTFSGHPFTTDCLVPRFQQRFNELSA
jgi:lysophospholipase L1-like esterase